MIEKILGILVTYKAALYLLTAFTTLLAARIADIVKDADAENKGLVKDGKGYPIESVWIPVLVGLLVVPFMWSVIAGTGMSFEMALSTAVLSGYASREFLTSKVATFIATIEK